MTSARCGVTGRDGQSSDIVSGIMHDIIAGM
jgi:hypothetical protein